MGDEGWAAELDALAEGVFGSAEGRARLEPLLARFDRAVGTLREDDPSHAIMQACRIDWALCDAALTGPGDTWAARAAVGAVAGVDPSDRVVALASSQVGVFEVWPGHAVWLRDCIRGISLPLRDRIPPWVLEQGGPAALWEARVVVEAGGAHMCRAPVEYPLEVRELLDRAHERRFRARDNEWIPPVDLQLCRKLRLRWERTHRGDPRVIFGPLA